MRRRSKSFKHAMQAREMYAARDEYIRQRYGDAEDSDAGAENIADEQPMQRLSTEPKSAECSPDVEKMCIRDRSNISLNGVAGGQGGTDLHVAGARGAELPREVSAQWAA